ncbi:cytochrome P450 monooxygenase [Xylaria acuta]|nr:cytochrome P450 monooxygenase [Xylaria acuta]
MAVLLEWLPAASVRVAVPVCLVVWYVVSCVSAWYRLRHVPGPFIASFSYLWMAMTAGSSKQAYIHRDLFKKYGPVVRIGPNEVATGDPEIARRAGATSGTWKRDDWYLGSMPDAKGRTMGQMQEPRIHDALRAKLAPAYNGRDVLALEPGVDGNIGDLKQLLRRRISQGGSVVDLVDPIAYFAIDVVATAAFGKPAGFLKQDRDVGDILSGIHSWVPGSTVMCDTPWIRNIVMSEWFFNRFGPKPTDPRGFGRIMRMSQEAVGKRFSSKTQREEDHDMLGSFIRRGGLGKEQCQIELLTTIVAGSDTTSSATRLTLLYLMTCPRVYYKLKGVIVHAIREGKASDPISQAEAKKIPYLQAVIHEGLRMRPPAPVLTPKVVPPEGEHIGGKFIPGGTAITSNRYAKQWELMRSPIFGDDVELFRPERFMEADENRRAEMYRTTELIFGSGRWQCAGKSLAFMELNKVFFELLRTFDFQLVNPTSPMDSTSYMLFSEKNLWVHVTEVDEAERVDPKSHEEPGSQCV